MFLSGVLVSVPVLGAFGAAGVTIGVLLAIRSDDVDAHKTLQMTAGLLLIAGFACFGVALFYIYGSPLP